MASSFGICRKEKQHHEQSSLSISFDSYLDFHRARSFEVGGREWGGRWVGRSVGR